MPFYIATHRSEPHDSILVRVAINTRSSTYYPETRRARNFLAIIIRASILNPQIETFFVLSGYTCKYDLPVYSIQFLQKEIQFSESCLFLYIKCIVVNQIRLWSCVFFTSKFLILLRTLTSPCICSCGFFWFFKHFPTKSKHNINFFRVLDFL